MRIVRYTQPRHLGFRGLESTPLAALQNELDSWFDSALSDLSSLNAVGPGLNQFPVDLYEDKDNTYVRAEIPGLSRDELSVEMSNGFLSISGSRKGFQEGGKTEESFSFSRSIEIPEEVNAEKVSAHYENGILTVTLPKREESKPRKISVNVK